MEMEMEEQTGFSSHIDEIIINLSSPTKTTSKKLIIKCVSELTPLDMIDLYNGTNDATGNQIWMGAYLFLQTLFVTSFNNHHHDDHNKITTQVNNIRNICQKAFYNKKVIELGCGSGISGLSLLLLNDEAAYRPLFVHFTDFDSSTLELCRVNCRDNLVSSSNGDRYVEIDLNHGEEMNKIDNDDFTDKRTSYYAISKLTWCYNNDNNDHHPNEDNYNTVIATDILYDISSLLPILHTAFHLLHTSGYFILSHIPRCSLNEEELDSGSGVICNTKYLEDLIYKKAQEVGFKSNIIKIQPLDLLRSSTKYDLFMDNRNACIPSLEEMQDVDAAIFVFQK